MVIFGLMVISHNIQKVKPTFEDLEEVVGGPEWSHSAQINCFENFSLSFGLQNFRVRVQKDVLIEFSGNSLAVNF